LLLLLLLLLLSRYTYIHFVRLIALAFDRPFVESVNHALKGLLVGGSVCVGAQSIPSPSVASVALAVDSAVNGAPCTPACTRTHLHVHTCTRTHSHTLTHTHTHSRTLTHKTLTHARTLARLHARAAFLDSYSGGIKGYERMANKMLSPADHYVEERPRPACNLDIVRCLATFAAPKDQLQVGEGG
jgi:hypothetical protein